MRATTAGLLGAVSASLVATTLGAQDTPIQAGSLQIAGTAQLIHVRDIGNDVSATKFELAPRLAYFPLRGLAVNGTLRSQRITSETQRTTGWGVGPGLTYYVRIHSSAVYPFVSGRTLFTWDKSRTVTPELSYTASATSLSWLVSGGVLIMVGRAVGISGDLFYQHDRYTIRSDGTPAGTNRGESYGLQWGVAAFIF